MSRMHKRATLLAKLQIKEDYQKIVRFRAQIAASMDQFQVRIITFVVRFLCLTVFQTIRLLSMDRTLSSIHEKVTTLVEGQVISPL